MTPKEKATELIDKMTMEIGTFNAKQCALIAVDEVLSISYFDPEHRKVSVFPAMEYCETCKSYSEGKCKNKHTVPVYFPNGKIDSSVPPFEFNETDPLFKTKTWFELWMKEHKAMYEEWNESWTNFLSSEHSA